MNEKESKSLPLDVFCTCFKGFLTFRLPTSLMVLIGTSPFSIYIKILYN